jgi:hypothetical protein
MPNSSTTGSGPLYEFLTIQITTEHISVAATPFTNSFTDKVPIESKATLISGTPITQILVTGYGACLASYSVGCHWSLVAFGVPTKWLTAGYILVATGPAPDP